MNSPKIFLKGEEVSITSPGQLDELILEAEQELPRDRRSKAFKLAYNELTSLYRLYNQLTNHRSYNV